MKSLYAFCISAVSNGITEKTFSLESLSEILPAELCYDIRQEHYSKMSPKLFLEELERCCRERENDELIMLCRFHPFFTIEEQTCCYSGYPGIQHIIRNYTLYLACKYSNEELIDVLKSSKDFKDYLEDVSYMKIYCAGLAEEIDNPLVLQAKRDCLIGEYHRYDYFNFLLGLYDGNHISILVQELSSKTAQYLALWEDYDYVHDCLPDVLDQHNINYDEAMNETNTIYHNKGIHLINGDAILVSLALKMDWVKRLEEILQAFKKDENNLREIAFLLLDEETFRAEYGLEGFQKFLVRLYDKC